MAIKVVVFVSKRLSALAAALLCVAMMQSMVSAHCQAPSPTEVRVVITR